MMCLFSEKIRGDFIRQGKIVWVYKKEFSLFTIVVVAHFEIQTFFIVLEVQIKKKCVSFVPCILLGAKHCFFLRLLKYHF